MPVTRFAPSPTGLLHLGHAYSALFAARAAGPSGRFLLRFEDIDHTRCRPDYADAIEADLGWLGLDWPRPVLRQSQEFARYRQSLDQLLERGLLYPCFCSRAEAAQNMAAPHGLAPIYAGTCRALSPADRQDRIAAGARPAWRLDLARAQAETGPLVWRDLDQGVIPARAEMLGDVILSRKDVAVSYHLAVCLDDALQGVELVTRGQDLFEATHIHRVIQALLGLPVPIWQHHRLLTDEHGKRFAKRDKALTLASLRAAGQSAADIRHRIGFADQPAA